MIKISSLTKAHFMYYDFADKKVGDIAMPFDVVTTAGTKITVLSKDESGGGTPGGDVDWKNIKNKPATFPPTIGTTATTAKAGNYVPSWSDITSKPTIPAAQIQSDWAQTDNTKVDFIKNKPTIPPAYTLPAATTTTLGGVKQGAAIADLEEGADTVAEINKLLANLRTAGIIAT